MDEPFQRSDGGDTDRNVAMPEMYQYSLSHRLTPLSQVIFALNLQLLLLSELEYLARNKHIYVENVLFDDRGSRQ
jgi:hypothetical protein